MWVQACFGQNQENILKCHQTKKSKQDYGDVELEKLNDIKNKKHLSFSIIVALDI